jgi:hypothetical protein
MAVDLTIFNHGIQSLGLLRMILAVIMIVVKDIVIGYSECY